MRRFDSLELLLPSYKVYNAKPLKHLFKKSDVPMSKRVEIVPAEVSHGERQCGMNFIVRPGWNPFLPLTNSSLVYYITFVCLSFLICKHGNNNTQRYICLEHHAYAKLKNV